MESPRAPGLLPPSLEAHDRAPGGGGEGCCRGFTAWTCSSAATAGQVGWGKGGRRRGSHLAAAGSRRLRGPVRRRCHPAEAGVGEAQS